MNHLFMSIESALDAGNYYAGLATALTLPDICGWVENPTVKSKERYVGWFDKYLLATYTRPAGMFPAHIFLSGSDFYALRCAFLHEGRDDITDQRAQKILDSFQFVAPRGNGVMHRNQFNETLQLQVDIFCREIIGGAKQFLSDITGNSTAEQRLTKLLLIKDWQGRPI